MKTKTCSSSSWADTGPLPHMHQLSYLSRKPQKRHSWSRGVTVVWCCFCISLASCLAFFSCLHLPSLLAWLLRSFVPCFLPYFLFLFPIFLGIGIWSTSFRCEKLCTRNCRGLHAKSLMAHGCFRQKSTQQMLPTVLPYSRAWIQKRSCPALKPPQKSLDAAKM